MVRASVLKDSPYLLDGLCCTVIAHLGGHKVADRAGHVQRQLGRHRRGGHQLLERLDLNRRRLVARVGPAAGGGVDQREQPGLRQLEVVAEPVRPAEGDAEVLRLLQARGAGRISAARLPDGPRRPGRGTEDNAPVARLR